MKKKPKQRPPLNTPLKKPEWVGERRALADCEHPYYGKLTERRVELNHATMSGGEKRYQIAVESFGNGETERRELQLREDSMEAIVEMYFGRGKATAITYQVPKIKIKRAKKP